jgi:hypothetical protein
MPTIINGTTGIDKVQDGTITADDIVSGVIPTGFGFKNRIINGNMRIDQRNAGASVSIASSGTVYFSVDRFQARMDTSTGSTTQQSTVAPSGFVNSNLVTVGTGASPASGAANYFGHRIEGFNIADFGWGTASASTVTLSFWVRSSLTGTFGVSLRNASTNRSYVSSYTINSADTWEQKSITIVGDTGGTWNTTNGIGAFLFWDTGIGSNISTSTTNSWQAANFSGLAGGVKLCETSGATFYITGVQLEKGSTATSFDYRPYGTELTLCQRYYARIIDPTCRGTGTGGTSGGASRLSLMFPVTMRAYPTLTTSGTFNFWNGASTATGTTVVGVFGSTSLNMLDFDISTSASFAVGNAVCMYAIGSSPPSIMISSEL